MKASLRWLRELCPELPDDPAEIAARFTAAGLEVEGTEAFGKGAEACVVAAVVSTRPHPSRTGLRLVTVDRGSGQQEVVCGAPNVPDVGGLVVLAPLGAHLPAKGMIIEKRAIAGVSSEGMLCSEAELGLTGESDGILLLPAGIAPVGTSLAKAMPSTRDTILEIGLTPNRPDGLGHIGLAREAAALFELAFQLVPLPPPTLLEEDLASYVSVTIEDGERCPHFGAAVLLSAKVGPSPHDVRWRLSSLGVRPISNLVDITNLAMLEAGHPLHAYDLDKVRGGKIVVRRAVEGEKIVTLDGVERTLVADDLVICDDEGPIGLAGVMGAGNSEITETTQRVLLECAYFEPRGVRRSARRHGMHTEASHRFERGVDWGDTETTLARAASLMGRLADAKQVKGSRIFEARALAQRTVTLRHARVSELLGIDVPFSEATNVLDRLGFRIRSSQPAMDVWQVPSFRPDVSREVDLVEEVARVRGFDAIPATLPAVKASRDAGPREALARRARESAVSLGMSEAITYAFVAPRDLEAVAAPKPFVTIVVNPLSEGQTVMRTSLVPGLLRAMANARRHGVEDARLFTVGTLFLEPQDAANAEATSRRLPDERLAFAALLAGHRPGWLSKPESVDVWDAKGLAEGIARDLFRHPIALRPNAMQGCKHLHPRGAAAIEVGSKRVGSLGPVHPDVLDAFDLGGAAVIVELDLDALEAIGAGSLRFSPLPRFPSSTRDLAVIVRDDVAAGDVALAVREAAGDLGEDVVLFDRFSGGKVAAGSVSLALHVVYRAKDRTLTDVEVDKRHAQVLTEVEKRFGALLRA